MLTNTANLCKQNLTITHNDRQLSADQIHRLVEYYKYQFWKAFDGNTLGRTILIMENNLDIVYPAVIAAWRMGMSIAVHEYNTAQSNHPAWREFYNFIDAFVWVEEGYNADNLIKRKIIPQQKVMSKEGVLPIVDAERHVPDVVGDFADVVAVKTHTSGTTGVPKVVSMTHKQVQDIAYAIIKMYNHNAHDRTLHHKTLHHGSLFLNYALPSWMSTANHHCIQKTTIDQGAHAFLNRTIDYCNVNKITKWMVVYNWIRKLPDTGKQFNHPIDLITIQGPTTNEMSRIFDVNKAQQVYHNFGNTEVGNLFLSITNLYTVKDYNPNKFTIQNPACEIEIEERYFRCRVKGTEKWYTVGDKLEVESDDIWWRGRTNTITKYGAEISVIDIQRYLEQYYETLDLYVVPNYLTNQLFLATFTNLDTTIVNSILADQFGIANLIDDTKQVTHTEYLHGQKPSMPLLLYLFNDKEKEYV